MFQRILFCCVIIGAQSVPVPILTPCKRDDSVCQTKNTDTLYKLAVKGVPELNIESLDPLHQDCIDGDLEVIKYKICNSTVEGFSLCDVVDMKLDLEKSTLRIDIVCPHLNMYGLYETSGQLLQMPVEGKGDFTLESNDYHLQLNTDIKLSERQDGKKYLSFDSFKVNAEVKGGMVTDFRNLFNGQQKELAENVNRFINENWKESANLLQGPAFNATFKKLLNNVNKYMKNVSLDQVIEQ